MRSNVEVAYPASDVGVDLLAYRLEKGLRTAGRFVPIQVKAQSGTEYRFLRSWFHRAPGLVLVHVWLVKTDPKFYVFSGLQDVEAALGDHANTESWKGPRGAWSATNPSPADTALMNAHKDRWDRITGQLGLPPPT
jgi:hypothetical protein